MYFVIVPGKCVRVTVAHGIKLGCWRDAGWRALPAFQMYTNNVGAAMTPQMCQQICKANVSNNNRILIFFPTYPRFLPMNFSHLGIDHCSSF